LINPPLCMQNTDRLDISTASSAEPGRACSSVRAPQHPIHRRA